MDYVSWMEQVATVLVSASDEAQDHYGIRISDLAPLLGLTRNAVVDECLRDALQDLTSMGLADDSHSAMGPDGGRWALTQRGQALREASLRTSWKQIFDLYLTNDQIEFLRAACRLSEEHLEGMARLNEVQGSDVAAELGRDWTETQVIVSSYKMVETLSDMGLTVDRAAGGGHLPLHLTYMGIVRATQAKPTADRELLEELLAEGETTNVDFKRELDLGRPAANAELVRDVLGMANAQVSGRRFIVVGIADDGSEFRDANDGLSQERIEQIVQSWAPPSPTLRVKRVLWHQAEIAIVEISRERAYLPYVATKRHGKLAVGVVYSRHGSHTEPATEDEERAIRTEGDRARAKQDAAE
jgi:schlafen family protein